MLNAIEAAVRTTNRLGKLSEEDLLFDALNAIWDHLNEESHRSIVSALLATPLPRMRTLVLESLGRRGSYSVAANCKPAVT